MRLLLLFSPNDPGRRVLAPSTQGVCDQADIDLNVWELMQPWLTRPKFPVLRVRVTGSNLVVTQQPFSFFALPREGTTCGDNSNIVAAKVARRVCQVGPGEGASEDEGARSPKLPRTGAPAAEANVPSPPHPPVPGGGPLEVSTNATGKGMQVSSTATATEGAAAAREGPEPAGISQPKRSPQLRGAGSCGDDTCWVVPLRIRVAKGSPRLFPGGASSRAVQENEGKHCSGSDGGRPGEEMHRILLTERSTCVALPSLSRELADAPSKSGEVDKGTTWGGEGCDSRGGSQEPYLVVNDGHSGFFTVQYECERSWELALAAVEEGALDECETMGFVHDLILPLHEGVLMDRRAASLSISGREERICGDGNVSCDVTCLFFRLEKVVRLLGRDRSHPAWSTGQLFIWELLIMCASYALGEVYELSHTRREAALPTQKRLGDSLEHNQNVSGTTESVVAVTGAKTGGGGDAADRGHAAAGSSPQAHQDAGGAGCAPGLKTSDGSLSSGVRRPKGGVVAEKTSSVAATTVARSVLVREKAEAVAQRLRSVATEMELALEEVEEHVRWYADRVACGMEQAGEGLQSLRAMRDRLDRSLAQLAWAQLNEVLETKA